MKNKSGDWISSEKMRPANGSAAFTLVELVVVIATILVLSALLLPALAGSKGTTWRAECAANLRQVGTGLALYTIDHNNKYPPAAYNTGAIGGPTWDTCINRYVGGNAPFSVLTQNYNHAPTGDPAQYCLSILWCPADRYPKTINQDPAGQWMPSWAGARKDYAVNGVFTPTPIVVGDGLWVNILYHGVGNHVNAPPGASATLDPPGYRASIVQDPAGTIQVAELSTYYSVQGNNWASFCCGPDWHGGPAFSGGANQYCFQLDSTQANLNTDTACYGGDVYRLQGSRFNYLFHDGHVAPLKYTDTIGLYAGSRNGAWSQPLNTTTPATTSDPGGMWTARKGD
jgi:prepilin-type processing-associated H-X9-DG protein